MAFLPGTEVQARGLRWEVEAPPDECFTPRPAAQANSPGNGAEAFLFTRVHPKFKDRYKGNVPLLTLKTAAGGFSDEQAPEFEDWVEIKTTHKLRKGMFVAQVVGRSMEPLIPDGSYCLFRNVHGGTRQGKIVLVQHHSISDVETGGTYTVKKYESDKAVLPDGTWRQTQIRLVPLNPEFKIIVIPEAEGEEMKIIAEWVEVIG
ncbi:MAG: S24 family peptidase [Deltaproteobacteria bacterium]|nr:S24 family peptidase [Deltaproteobacteria bacterium]